MSEIQASKVQKTKYEKFLAHHLKDQCIAFLKEIIGISGLSLSDIGITWGVTLMPDSNTLARVNVGNWEFVSVYSPQNGKESRVLICVKGQPRMPVLIPKSLVVSKSGFANLDEDFAMRMSLGRDSAKMLGMKNIQTGILEGAKSRMKKGLPNPNWHNPMSEGLIFE